MKLVWEKCIILLNGWTLEKQKFNIFHQKNQMQELKILSYKDYY